MANENVPLSAEQALHKIRFDVDDIEELLAMGSYTAYDVQSYLALDEIRDLAYPSYIALDDIRDGVGSPSDAEALTGDGAIIAILKALRTLVQQEQEIYHDYSGIKTLSISYNTYDATYPADLGGIFDIIRIFCPDATYIPPSSYFDAYVSISYPSYGMMSLREQDSPGTSWAQTTFLPTTGTFDFVLTHAAGTRWLSLSLTNPSGGELQLYTYGVHRSA
jgi:hypothetical protein